MNENHTEIEIKVHVHDLARLEQRLQDLGAELIQPRQMEVNLRFDRRNRTLAQKQQVLRLRRDNMARLTFKGPGITQDGVRTRQEIEFTVSDFNSARLFLEALGFQVYTIYEKYRASYRFMGCQVELDELPYGNFCEIEGPDPATIRSVSVALGLNWEVGVSPSYTDLFQQLRKLNHWPFHDLMFKNFEGIKFNLEDAGVMPAD